MATGQPLTKKRHGAIKTYVGLKHVTSHATITSVVEATLKAERMKADHLYALLQKHGFRWKQGRWQ